jgi:excisionase family DNA binding protein
MAPSTERHLITVQQAAYFLCVSVSTLYGWVWQRKIPFVKIGRALRFETVDLEKFVQSHKYEAKKSCEWRQGGPDLRTIRGAAGKG